MTTPGAEKLQTIEINKELSSAEITAIDSLNVKMFKEDNKGTAEDLKKVLKDTTIKVEGIQDGMKLVDIATEFDQYVEQGEGRKLNIKDGVNNVPERIQQIVNNPKNNDLAYFVQKLAGLIEYQTAKAYTTEQLNAERVAIDKTFGNQTRRALSGLKSWIENDTTISDKITFLSKAEISDLITKNTASGAINEATLNVALAKYNLVFDGDKRVKPEDGYKFIDPHSNNLAVKQKTSSGTENEGSDDIESSDIETIEDPNYKNIAEEKTLCLKNIKGLIIFQKEKKELETAFNTSESNTEKKEITKNIKKTEQKIEKIEREIETIIVNISKMLETISKTNNKEWGEDKLFYELLSKHILATHITTELSGSKDSWANNQMIKTYFGDATITKEGFTLGNKKYYVLDKNDDIIIYQEKDKKEYDENKNTHREKEKQKQKQKEKEKTIQERKKEIQERKNKNQNNLPTNNNINIKSILGGYRINVKDKDNDILGHLNGIITTEENDITILQQGLDKLIDSCAFRLSSQNKRSVKNNEIGIDQKKYAFDLYNHEEDQYSAYYSFGGLWLSSKQKEVINNLHNDDKQKIVNYLNALDCWEKEEQKEST